MGYTGLHWAAVNGHMEIAQLLLNAGANVEAVNDRTCSLSSTTGLRSIRHPLTAGLRCHMSRRRLIDRGACTAGGATPLFLAAQNGQLAVAELLVDQGRADLDATHHASVRSLAPYSALQHPLRTTLRLSRLCRQHEPTAILVPIMTLTFFTQRLRPDEVALSSGFEALAEMILARRSDDTDIDTHGSRRSSGGNEL